MLPTRPSTVLLACLLVGCKGSDKESLPSDSDASGEDFIDVAECDSDAGAIASVDTEQPEAANLAVVVSWTLSQSGTARVIYGPDADDLTTTNASADGTSGSVVLRGLHQHQDIHLRVIASVGGATSCSEEIAVSLGGLDPHLPVLTADGEGDPDELVVAPILQTDSSYLAMLDGTGEIRWAAALDTMPWKAQRANNENSILYNSQPEGTDGDGSVIRMNFDGTTETLWKTGGLHTDFVQLQDGTLGGMIWDTREVDYGGNTYFVMGDALVEHSVDGEDRVLWSTFDTFTPDLSKEWPSTGGEYPALDWSHANGISYDEANDAYLVSIAGVQSLVSVDRTTGALNWVVGPDEGDLAPDPADMVYNAHSIYAYGDGYVIFNRNDTGGSACSDVTSFSLDLDAGTATMTNEYTGSECLSVYYLGEARPLCDDGLLVVWATSGKLERLDADWNNQWSVVATLGSGFGFSDVLTTLYPTE